MISYGRANSLMSSLVIMGLLNPLFLGINRDGALVVLGSLSGLLGKIYGQMPALVPSLVAILAVAMGLNLLGLLRIRLPAGPDPNSWRNKVPAPFAPVAAGWLLALQPHRAQLQSLLFFLGGLPKAADH